MGESTTGEGVFGGPAGTTHTVETAIYCGGCGAIFGARLLGGIDAAADPALVRRLVEGGIGGLNQAECGSCGWRTSPADPVLVHRPGEAMFLVLPAAMRHRVRQAQAEALRRLLPAPGDPLPGYALALRVLAEDDLHLAATLLPEGAREKPRPASDLPFTPPGAAWDDAPRRPLDRPTLLDDPLGSHDISVDLASAARPDSRPPASPPRLPPESLPPESLPPESLPPESLPPESITDGPAPGADAATTALHDALELADEPPFDDPLASRDVSLEDVSVDDASLGDASVDDPGSALTSVSIALSMDEADAEASRDVSLDAILAETAPADASVDVSGEGLLAEILSARPGVSPPTPPAEAAGPPAAWEALEDAWSLDAARRDADDDPTHVVHADDVEPRRPAGPPFDAGRASERGTYLELGADGVAAVARVDRARGVAFLNGEAELRFQLHATAEGPVVGLLLVHLDAGGAVDDHVFWPIVDETPEGEALLERLEAAFEVNVRLYDEAGEGLGHRRFTAPLESNVGTARIVLLGAEGDRAQARRLTLAPDFDRVGRLRHNFTEESFVDVQSAADARLALGIIGYWSTPERRDYLLRIKAFPEIWFEAMTRRVLRQALDFGLAMEPHLRQRSLELKLAQNSAALLRRSLANFAEVNLNLKPSGLDPLDVWDNWEALLAHAEELDLRVDEEIEELAARAMERARQAAQSVVEPAEIHLADESIELEEVIEVGDLADEDLLSLLGTPSGRLDATLALLQKGDAIFVPAIFDAIKTMGRDELLAAVPAALAIGPAFEAHFLGGLRSRRTSLRLAAALFLSEIRSERATGPLLAQASSAPETEWAVLSRAAARMGRRIVGPALDLVASEGDPGDRVAYTLALLGGEARGALAAARDQRTDARVRACLTAAIDRMNEVSFGDAADFMERLADAFAAAGPDLIGPDFEEVLESVDLGPGASMSDLETDVNLDGLDE